MIKIFIISLFLILSHLTLASDFKDKPITIISGFSFGSTDQALKPYIEAFEKNGYKIVVQHKPGANGIVALNYFSDNAKPDGYTLFATASSMFTLAPIISSDILKNNEIDLITTIAAGPIVLISNKQSNVKSLKEFQDDLLKNDNTISIASPSLFFEYASRYLIRESTKKSINVPIVNYKSGSDAIKDVLGGHVKYGVLQLSVATPFINSGNVNIIAISGEKRFTGLPNTPTFSEFFPNFNSNLEASWGIGLPKNTDPKIYKFYYDFFTKIAKEEETKEKLSKTFMIIPNNYIGKKAFENRIDNESIMWKSITVNNK
jgi:tripartite-type tricarboxylate transporter receptor subunit TctC